MNQTEKRIISRVLLGIFLGVLACCSAPVGVARADFISGFPAAPGGLESPTVLDITSYSLAVSYDGAGHLAVNSQFDGLSLLNNDSTAIYDIGGTGDMAIAITINPATSAPISGTLDIAGQASSFYTLSSSNHLLTGTISQFGFPNASQGAAANNSENFQFIFNTTGGDLAAFYPAIAVNVSLVHISFNGSFGATSFNDVSGNAQADTYAGVPEPTTLSMGCVGLMILIGRFGFLGTRRLN